MMVDMGQRGLRPKFPLTNNFSTDQPDRTLGPSGQSPPRSPPAPTHHVDERPNPAPHVRTEVVKRTTLPREQLGEIARLVDAGTIRPQVGAVYPLAKGREAFTAKSTPGIPGRVVLHP
jgi:hypothetical protein